MQNFKLVPVFMLFILAPLKAQPTLWNIQTTDNQPYTNVMLDRFSGDTLYVNGMGQTFPIPLKSIYLMHLHKKPQSYIGPGINIGMIGGWGAGYYYGYSMEQNPELRRASGTVLGFIGFTVGGFIGAIIGSGSTSQDNDYLFGNMTLPQKQEKIKELLKLRT